MHSVPRDVALPSLDSGHPALRQDAAAAAEPGDRNQVRRRNDCAVVRERRGAPTLRSRTSEFWPPQVVLDSALVESFNRVLLSGRSLVFSYPTVHTQQSTVPGRGGAQRHRRAPSRN